MTTALHVPPSPALSASNLPGPFEGPEKLLEVWFAPSPDALPATQASVGGSSSTLHTTPSLEDGLIAKASSSTAHGRTRPRGVQTHWRGLRRVPREVWEEMLDIVKCKVLSVVEGEDLDAYLLSESSLFVAPHLLILKTCGTTLNLLGLHRIIEIAREYCGFTNIWRCFYSRKSFFFPERQSGPHKDWRDEVRFLDSTFGSAGSAYTVGPMNRDHWLLYLTSPNTQPLLPSDSSLTTDFRLSLPSIPSLPPVPSSSLPSPPLTASPPVYQDTTLEILMSHLSPAGRAPFFPPSSPELPSSGHELGKIITSRLGVDKLFSESTLDSYGFDPCGYSANAVVGTGGRGVAGGPDGGYFTIHVTPEEGWSYASFECNVPLPTQTTFSRPDLPTLIANVVNIFQPNRLSITLFVSTSASSSSAPPEMSHAANGDAIATVFPNASASVTSESESRAWKAFGADLLGREFERKDRIGYEFDGYDLVFACFERRGWVEPKKYQS